MRKAFSLLILLASLLTSCSGGELVGVHLTLSKDGSGTITTRALMPSSQTSPAETRAKGVTWDVRAALVSSQGSFDAIGSVSLGDGEVTFAPQLDGDRPGLRVMLQRGPNCKWIEALVPDEAARKRMAKAYDPSGRTKEIGDVLRIEIAAPGSVITSGVLPTGRGVQADRDGNNAVLLLPVRTALKDGNPFAWDISWLRQN